MFFTTVTTAGRQAGFCQVLQRAGQVILQHQACCKIECGQQNRPYCECVTRLCHSCNDCRSEGGCARASAPSLHAASLVGLPLTLCVGRGVVAHDQRRLEGGGDVEVQGAGRAVQEPRRRAEVHAQRVEVRNVACTLVTPNLRGANVAASKYSKTNTGHAPGQCIVGRAHVRVSTGRDCHGTCTATTSA